MESTGTDDHATAEIYKRVAVIPGYGQLLK